MNANTNAPTAKTVSGGLLGRCVLKPLADWRARQRAMDELMSLDDQMLKDIGVARCEIPGIVAGNVVPRWAANENLVPQSGTARRK
jgi:uncharacterized protein YjiS (DUF1127 family)